MQVANVRSANTFYIDTQSASSSDDLVEKGLTVTHVIVTATSASAVLVLQDTTTTITKCDLRVATSGATQVFDFSDNPIIFPNGVKPSTRTNAVATLVLKSRGA